MAVLTLPLVIALIYLYFRLCGTYVVGPMVRDHQRRQVDDPAALAGLAALDASRETTQAWVYARPFDPIDQPLLLAEDWVLRDMLRDKLAIQRPGTALRPVVLPDKGRDELASGRLAGHDGTATAMEIALCGSLAAALAVRQRKGDADVKQAVLDRANVVGEGTDCSSGETDLSSGPGTDSRPYTATWRVP